MVESRGNFPGLFGRLISLAVTWYLLKFILLIVTETDLERHILGEGWKTDRFLVPFRPGALFPVTPVPASAPNPRSERPPRTPGEMQT